MKQSTSKGAKKNEFSSREIDWELRPGGMLAQKREVGREHCCASGPMIKVKVSHGCYQYDISIRAQSTFGDLNKLLADCISGISWLSLSEGFHIRRSTKEAPNARAPPAANQLSVNESHGKNCKPPTSTFQLPTANKQPFSQ